MSEQEEKRPRLQGADRIYTGVALAALLLAGWFAFAGGKGDVTQADRSPVIRIEDPRADATLSQPVALIFATRAVLRPDGSDSAGVRHVHADVGARMLMPGATDIRPLGPGRYQWTLPVLPPGEAVLRVYWSDGAHRAIANAPRDSVRVRLR
jgi:hypothetical protein